MYVVSGEGSKGGAWVNGDGTCTGTGYLGRGDIDCFHGGIITGFLNCDVPCSFADDIVEGNDEILIEGDACGFV